MSLFGGNAGGSGGFGFGGNNNNNQAGNTPSVFGSGGGGFGQPSAAPGFGNNTGGGFGQQNQQNTPGAFGAAANTGFGATTGGFGTNNAASSPFGAAKPAFGATNNAPAAGGLFGNTTANTNTGGGFGFGATQPSNAFGGGNTAASGGGLFGGAKPAFGTATTTAGTTGGLFGAAGAATGGGVFGNPGANTGFGTGAGASNQVPIAGTTNPPYQAHVEKEQQGNVTNHFQTIAFMPAYAKYSLEELRLQDYAQGRRYGNDSGSGGGGFGGTGFGGNFANNNANTGAFGTTNTAASGGGAGGLFGNNNATTTPFGAQPANNAFGANNNTTTSGGLFSVKPATSGLFSGATTATTGGLFGTNSNNTGAAGAFGNNTATTGFGTNTNTGGGLFGNNQANQNNQQKPPFAFNNTGTTGFGATATTGGAFGAGNTGGGGLFGNNQNQQQPAANNFGGQQPANNFGGGAFGNNPAQNQPAAGFGGGFGGAQQQQPKPAFGPAFTNTATNNTTTQGGLFGNNQPQNTGGLFSNQPKPFGATPTTTQPAGGGLFGNNAAPQTNAGGLFGNNQPAGNTGGGLFGGQQNTGNTGGLFGNNNAPKPTIGGGLFGNNAAAPTQNTGGLFGLNPSISTAPSGPLFNNNQPQQQQQQMGSSLFGNSFGAGQQGQQQQQLQQQSQFTTSINDSPYGLSLMSSMNNYQAAPVGPIASPLSSNVQTKKAAMIPHYKIAPRQPSLAPRLGASFSRSGSPFATSTSANTALSTGTSLSRSFSSNNKLHLFDSDDSVLSSGSFTPNSGARVASLKKLVIDKKIRDQDLFSGGQDLRKEIANNENLKGNGTKSILKKTVSFDVAANKGTNADFFSANGQASRETTGPAPSAEEMGYLRSPASGRRSMDGSANGASSSTLDAQTETSTALAVVEKPKEDKSHGSYWMVPNAQKLKTMPKEQQKKLIGLTIGRRGYGQVRFDNPVDITAFDNPEEIPGNVVIFDVRVCTVYPETMEKPLPGKGLNVPATITLEDCFPVSKNERGKIRDPEHPRYASHIRRLKSIKDTEFVNYLANEGIWIFKVRHFTTYGLVDSDDEVDITYDESLIRNLPTGGASTPTRSGATSSYFDREDSMDASDADVSGMDTTGVFDDTFDFKRMGSSTGRNSHNDGFPGSFLGEDEVDATFDTYGEDEEEEEGEEGVEEGDTTMTGESFLGEGSVGSVEEEDEPAEPVSEEDEDETAQDLTVVLEEDEEDDDTVGAIAPAEFGRVQSPVKDIGLHGTPRALPLGKDWTEQLNATISPQKKRFGGTNFFSPSKAERTSPMKKMEPLNYGVLDLANDLYGGSRINGGIKKGKGEFSGSWDKVESPKSSRYQQETNQSAKRLELEDENALERNWRRAVRSAWGHDGTIVFVGGLEGLRQTRKGGGDGLKAAKLKYSIQDPESHVTLKSLEHQLNKTTIRLDEYKVPVAGLDTKTLFQSFTELPWAQDAANQHEKNVWALASVLWDPTDERPKFDLENDTLLEYMREKRRKEKLSKFLEELVEADADEHVHSASTPEEAAFAHLTAHRVEEACAALLEAGDFRLSTLLPMIGGDAGSRDLIRKQIDEWRRKGVLSEVAVPIRALYELLSGNTCFSDGVKGPQEDAAPEFFLTQKFGLDWKRGFGLKLWYGCAEEEGIGSAVAAYENEMTKWPGNVPAPLPWYHNISRSDNYDTLDILWGLLKLYADKEVSLEEVLSPRSVGASNLDYRLSWQLRTILSGRGIRDFSGRVRVLEDGREEFIAGSMADQVTVDFAGGLETGGLWEWAIFVLLHLVDTDSRETAIRNILGRHLDEPVELEGPEVAKKLEFLEKKLLIPQAWIFEARALKARHSGEHLIEAEYLLSARAWNEAHKTVVQQVAPEAIITGDLEQLKAILAKFEDVNLVDRWSLGGQVYLDYITLVEFVQGSRSAARNPVVVKTEQKGLPDKNAIKDVAERLLLSLKSADRKLFLQNVAIREMAGVVGSWVLKSGEMLKEPGKVLELPLTEDQYLRKTIHLSHSYYKARLQNVR